MAWPGHPSVRHLNEGRIGPAGFSSRQDILGRTNINSIYYSKNTLLPTLRKQASKVGNTHHIQLHHRSPAIAALHPLIRLGHMEGDAGFLYHVQVRRPPNQLSTQALLGHFGTLLQLKSTSVVSIQFHPILVPPLR
jgi:hypothetical protein